MRAVFGFSIPPSAIRILTIGDLLVPRPDNALIFTFTGREY